MKGMKNCKNLMTRDGFIKKKLAWSQVNQIDQHVIFQKI
jgi:hypothetical protein